LFESCFIFIFFLLFIIIIFFLLVVSPTASTEPSISGAIAAQFEGGEKPKRSASFLLAIRFFALFGLGWVEFGRCFLNCLPSSQLPPPHPSSRSQYGPAPAQFGAVRVGLIRRFQDARRRRFAIAGREIPCPTFNSSDSLHRRRKRKCLSGA
jgi:hypothetical protein